MTERLLQFIWQFRYFNPHELCVDTGEPLAILSPGESNKHQGPDFLQAEIRIGDTTWVGNIELHLLASGWEKHAHGRDRNYDNVILHVIWENDRETNLTLPKARDIPVLVLQHRVPKLLLGKYGEWMKSRSFIACERQAHQAGKTVWSGWKQSLLIGRMERRTLFIGDQLRTNHQHWEQTTWWMMARNFGIPVNTDAFGAIARSLPLNILSRHRHRPEQLEALFLGQAGLLERDLREDYPGSLKKEFYHLRGKYRLPPVHEPVLSLRMRPGNLPSVRLVQLAGLLHRSCTWFGAIREAMSLQELMGLLDAKTPEGSYWDRHYVLEKRSVFKVKSPGLQMKENILINTFLPLLYAYGSLRKEEAYRQKALRWLEELGAEKNSLTTGWTTLGIDNRNAADSQALLELKTRYCDPRRCLECAVGKALLQPFRRAWPLSS